MYLLLCNTSLKKSYLDHFKAFQERIDRLLYTVKTSETWLSQTTALFESNKQWPILIFQVVLLEVKGETLSDISSIFWVIEEILMKLNVNKILDWNFSALQV